MSSLTQYLICFYLTSFVGSQNMPWSLWLWFCNSNCLSRSLWSPLPEWELRYCKSIPVIPKEKLDFFTVCSQTSAPPDVARIAACTSKQLPRVCTRLSTVMPYTQDPTQNANGKIELNNGTQYEKKNTRYKMVVVMLTGFAKFKISLLEWIQYQTVLKIMRSRCSCICWEKRSNSTC